MVSLGNARDEKGILEILEAIRLLRAEPAGLEGLRFTLQANDAVPEIAAAIDSFALELPEQVRLLRRALSPEAYAALLAESDLVLLPYWREIYEARTSGVLPEALGGGRPVICTAGTWMADELALCGAGLLVADHDPAGLAAAIRQAHAAWPRLAAGALAGRAFCLARHGGAPLMRALMAPPPPPLPPEPPRRVQVFYPWPDFLGRSAGASLRSNLMAEVVAPHVEELRVMQDGAAPTTRRGNILVEALHERRLIGLAKGLTWRGLRLLTRPLSGAAQQGEVLFPWLHLQRMVDPFFRRRMERLIGGSDAVLLEYGFWSAPVLEICERLGVPCVLTAHDVIEDRVAGSALLRRLTEWLERRALRRAPHVVAVTPGDAARFAALGVTAQVIPNPVDLGAMSKPLPAPPRLLLERLGIDLPDRPFGLFVGSRHPPNIAAVAALREVAARMHQELGEAAPMIVVAGSAAPAEEAPGFLALGQVHAMALAALYQAASIALVPLPEGTGSSLKTLEAMAAGLPVLGTAVAFRGLAVTQGEQGLVEDALERWPALLPALTADPARLARLAEGGRALAARYDHRLVMAAYLPLLGLAEDAAPMPALPQLLAETPPFPARIAARPALPAFSGGTLPVD
nr:glycosyltransferase [Falsiroseomonas tokyonensis]